MRSQSYQSLGGTYSVTGNAAVATRAQFITRTYNHVFGAILAFVGLQFLFFQTGAAPRMAEAMLSVNWLWILGAFIYESTVRRVEQQELNECNCCIKHNSISHNEY